MPRHGEPGSGKGRSSVRGLIELVVCTAISASLLKAFLVEGFLISTGSMAPHLLGFHKQIRCPDCGFAFARGTAVDGPSEQPRVATCTNCGRQGIDVAAVPRNEGDQLLVHKLPWLFQPVARWEPMVFRQPDHATTAFVKRVVGLPGESIRIRDGNIYANGKLCRKTLAEQEALAIPVYIDRHRSTKRASRWTTESGWTDRQPGFDFASVEHVTRWLSYRHHDIEEAGRVRDRYAYNPREPRSRTETVGEILVRATLLSSPSVGRMVIELDTGHHQVAWIRDPRSHKQWLTIAGRRIKTLPMAAHASPTRQTFAFSTIDRTLRAAINGRLVFPPVALPQPGPPRLATESRTPVKPLLRIGASAGDLEVRNLRIDRDVFYRAAARQHAADKDWKLGDTEYFMLGDNSPVSLDSRSWTHPAVPRRLIIGRPVLVHLPSTQWPLSTASGTRHIRIPDVSRIRYIR